MFARSRQTFWLSSLVSPPGTIFRPYRRYNFSPTSGGLAVLVLSGILQLLGGFVALGAAAFDLAGLVGIAVGILLLAFAGFPLFLLLTADYAWGIISAPLLAIGGITSIVLGAVIARFAQRPADPSVPDALLLVLPCPPPHPLPCHQVQTKQKQEHFRAVVFGCGIFLLCGAGGIPEQFLAIDDSLALYAPFGGAIPNLWAIWDVVRACKFRPYFRL